MIPPNFPTNDIRVLVRQVGGRARVDPGATYSFIKSFGGGVMMCVCCLCKYNNVGHEGFE